MNPLLDARPTQPVTSLTVQARLPISLPPASSGEPPTVPDVTTLAADLHQLPAQRPALLRVVAAADDPDCSARRLAEVSELDPAFAARLLQLANSAYYGRAGRVTALAPAVAVLGAETLRGLAVTMALGLSGEHGPLPSGFRERAASTAAGSRLLAPRVGADPGDAFCVGLLCEVGQALLFRAAPAEYARLLTLEEPALGEAERAWCGTTSGELAAAALRATGLPDPVCRAIASHRSEDPRARALPLARALRAGVLLARVVAAGEVAQQTSQELDDVVGGHLELGVLRDLALRTAAQAAALSASLR